MLANFITLEARDGEARELDLALRMVPVNNIVELILNLEDLVS